MEVTKIAKVCHEVNKSYCESLGDNSQQPWEDAPEWQRTSAIKGVQFQIDNPDSPPSASHESWLKEKEEDGWKYGSVKNAETKEHPCFVSYEQLPIEQQSKDHIFSTIVRNLVSI